jgi:hypothetical protein
MFLVYAISLVSCDLFLNFTFDIYFMALTELIYQRERERGETGGS